MPPPIQISATYRVVTPCFCGGAGQRAEFRLPSFKGVLRFWWRALALARCGSLAAVQQEEGLLFGSPADGQSLVRMWLTSRPDAPVEPAGRVLASLPGARYLSYGMTDAGRSSLRAPFEVTIQLQCRPTRSSETAAELARSLREALVAVGLFGGVGAKSRKGFGSLVLTELQVAGEEPAEAPWSPPGGPAELAERVAGFARLGAELTDYPEYTALSAHARFLLVDGEQAPPLQLVELIGQEYKAHLREVGEAGPLHRAGFGLPRHVGPQAEMAPSSLTRRASPLCIHIHECDGRPVAVLAFLPAQFLPRDQNWVRVPQRRGSEPRAAMESTVYPPVADFLARLADRDRRSPSFPHAVWEVRG